MIFCIIFLVIFICVITICEMYLKTKDPDSMGVFLLQTIAFIISCSLFIISIALITRSGAFENQVMQMRAHPENLSIQNASETNEILIDIAYWQNTIFTWHRNLDTTLLDLSKFVSM